MSGTCHLLCTYKYVFLFYEVLCVSVPPIAVFSVLADFFHMALLEVEYS
jgi:hypothetical protein